MSKEKPTAADRLSALTKETPKNTKIQKEEVEKVDRRHFNKRPANSGRKTKETTLIERGIKKYLDDHGWEKQKVTIQDPKTGKTRIIEKTRLMIVLEKLYQLGVKGEGNADALNKWLDRILGKPVQPIAGDEDKPIVLRIDF